MEEATQERPQAPRSEEHVLRGLDLVDRPPPDRAHALGVQLLPRLPNGVGSKAGVRTMKYHSRCPATSSTCSGKRCSLVQMHGPSWATSSPALFPELTAGGVLVGLAGLEPAADRGPDGASADTLELPEKNALVHVDHDHAHRLANAHAGHSVSSRSARNQRSRSSQGTAAFAGDVDGRTNRRVSPSRRSWSPCPGRPPNGPR